MAFQRTIRFRIHVSTSTKGIKTPDCTVEITTTTDDESLNPIILRQQALRESDALVAELAKRYPSPAEASKCDIEGYPV